MDIQQQNRPYLETIQEESEQKDEIEESEKGDFQIQVAVETKEVRAEDGSEEDEDEDDSALLRVLRPRRASRSLRQKSFPRMQSTNSEQGERENFPESDQSSQSVHLSDGAKPTKQARSGNEKSSSSGELRVKISKIKWQKDPVAKSPVMRKTKKKSQRKESPVEEPFPEWLVNLMVNIEEATTHQLVVE
uniref:neurofilament medium polypeptide-like n=1 Tax=Scatophagus argus TaxID=75038 RepID=UPI001ED80DAD|nr:neurofilament medium polypeptide-like [Scatophagus argus]